MWTVCGEVNYERKKIDIGIKGLGESLKDFSAAWKKIASGKKVRKEEDIYFDTMNANRARI
jgi:hypothetical protein